MVKRVEGYHDATTQTIRSLAVTWARLPFSHATDRLGISRLFCRRFGDSPLFRLPLLGNAIRYIGHHIAAYLGPCLAKPCSSLSSPVSGPNFRRGGDHIEFIVS